MPSKKETAKAKARAKAKAKVNANANQYNPFVVLFCWFFNSLPLKCQDLLTIFVGCLGIIANLLGMLRILNKLLYSVQSCEQLINWGVSRWRPDMALTYPIASIMNTWPVSHAISVANYVSMLYTIIWLVYASYLIGNVVIHWIRKRRLQITWDPRYVLFFVLSMIGVADARRTIMQGVGPGNNPMSHMSLEEYNNWRRRNYPNHFACFMAIVLSFWFNGEGPAGFPAGCIIWFEWYDEYNQWVIHVQNVKLLIKHMKIATSRLFSTKQAQMGIVETKESDPYDYTSDNHRNELMNDPNSTYKCYVEAFDLENFERAQIDLRQAKKLTADGSGDRWGAGEAPSQIYDRRHREHIHVMKAGQVLLRTEKAAPVGHFFNKNKRHTPTEAVVTNMKKKFFELNRSRPIRKVYRSHVLICKARSTPAVEPLDI